MEGWGFLDPHPSLIVAGGEGGFRKGECSSCTKEQGETLIGGTSGSTVLGERRGLGELRKEPVMGDSGDGM